tara:strand:- start:20 stop:976 length:957 start_codon:yes stop_codon:yes gene_type:complete
MIDFQYLKVGLTGMARAHRAGTMAGHLGAAVVAGVFFGEDHPNLDEKVVADVQGELDRVITGGEAIWFDSKKAGITIPDLFEPLPKESPSEAAIPDIGVVLAADIAELRQSGHDVIFASIALRALHDHPELASPAVVVGIQKLITGFHGAPQGRGYFGKERGWLQGAQVKLTEESDFPPYADEDAMVEIVIDELIHSAGIRRQGYGGLFHLINHAAALTELSRFGYRGLARQGLDSHHRHLRLYRSLPDVEDELGPLQKAKHDPRTASYWETDKDSEQWSAHLTHRIKTLYGFYTLLRQIEDPNTRVEAERAFRYLMA